MKIVLLLTTFLLLFIINLLLKMIIPLIFADYFVKSESIIDKIYTLRVRTLAFGLKMKTM